MSEDEAVIAAEEAVETGRECWHGERFVAGDFKLYVYGCCHSSSVLITPTQRAVRVHVGAGVRDAMKGARRIAEALCMRALNDRIMAAAEAQPGTAEPPPAPEASP